MLRTHLFKNDAAKLNKKHNNSTPRSSENSFLLFPVCPTGGATKSMPEKTRALKSNESAYRKNSFEHRNEAKNERKTFATGRLESVV
ncbi:cytochrome b561-like protein [Anopheles sinensis]|uniref:Cytochrome b561-like protein n=1 Tax=Anopheles sinensis TaxID=74873 RepID=A0A084W035_ANOSI|nr:cytochrome b561-like protein [Anopheles sinensis]